MVRLDHIVLLFREKPVLGGEQAGELTREGRHDQIPAVAKVLVSGGLVAEQGQPFASQIRWGGRYKMLNSNGNHGAPVSEDGEMTNIFFFALCPRLISLGAVAKQPVHSGYSLTAPYAVRGIIIVQVSLQRRLSHVGQWNIIEPASIVHQKGDRRTT
jgi:hypothetical protein